jgi:hypothetical protein
LEISVDRRGENELVTFGSSGSTARVQCGSGRGIGTEGRAERMIDLALDALVVSGCGFSLSAGLSER